MLLPSRTTSSLPRALFAHRRLRLKSDLLVANAGPFSQSTRTVALGRRAPNVTFSSSSSSTTTGTNPASNRLQGTTQNSTASTSFTSFRNTQYGRHFGEYGRLACMVSGRVVLVCGVPYVFQEYGFQFIMCEGPSMMPTIRPVGEIILVECFSHWLWGLEGGDVGSERAKARVHHLQQERRLETLSNARQQWRGRQPEPDNQSKEAHATNAKPPPESSPRPVESRPSSPNFLRQVFTVLSSGVSVGDVVVLQHPQRDGTVCKRVIGLPGDIVIRNSSSSAFATRWDHPISRRHRKKHVEVVPDGHVWVEGDNSTNSADSRTYGPVPASLIVGRVLFRLWPLRGNATICRSRPLPPTGAAFTGSTVVPAGYDD